MFVCVVLYGFRWTGIVLNNNNKHNNKHNNNKHSNNNNNNIAKVPHSLTCAHIASLTRMVSHCLIHNLFQCALPYCPPHSPLSLDFQMSRRRDDLIDCRFSTKYSAKYTVPWLVTHSVQNIVLIWYHIFGIYEI